MSVSDGTDNQCCETTTEPYGVAMGDVLAKGYYNDEEKLKTSEQSTDDSEDEDSRLSSERQAADGASDALDDISSPINLSRLAHTIVDDPPGNDSFDDTALRIEPQVANLTSAESTCTDTEHSLDCSYAVCPNDCSQHPDSFCPCDTCKLCKLKRAMIDDELKREIRWHRLWTELRDHIRSVFEAALEATVEPNTVQYQCDPCRLNQLRENVVQMCKRNSQQLLLMLIVQAQEFVVELKNRIKETLHDHSLTNVAEIFLTRILDGYDAFVSTAKQVSDLVKPVEERHLLKFNLTWEFFNKALYENHIWISEPSMRNVTGSFTTQLTKSRKRHSYQALFERYVAFVAEMMRVAELWPETERLIVKWNDKQTADRGRASDISPLDSSNVSSSTDILPRSQDKCEGSNEEEIAEGTLRTPDSVPHSLSNGTSVNVSTETNGKDSFSSLSPITRAAKAIVRKDFEAEDRKGLLKKRASTGSIANNPLHELDVALRHRTDIVQEIANDFSESMDREPERQMCQCIYEHMREIDETGRTWWSDSPCLCVLNLRWLCGVSKACPCLSTAPTTKSLLNERPESPTSTTLTTPTVKQTRHSTTQTANSMITDSTSVEEEEETTSNGSLISTATATTTTMTTTTTTTTPTLPPTTHNHNHNSPHQGPCSTHNHFHGTSTDSTKSTGSSHRAHSHNNHALHIYRKHAKVEEIKRILCNDLSPGDGDCSDSGSSQEDSCSTSSSTPRDSSRHCDCCYCEVFGPGLPSVAPVSRNYNEMRERLRQLLTKKKAKKCKAPCSPPKSPAESSIASSTSTDHKATPPLRSAPSRSNTPIPLVSTIQPEQRDQRDLEALLEFIEGNQGTKKDNKKTEKKARQKQRKLDEMLRKEKEEADKQKLIELQKKTPEVTITVVDPLKPISQRLPQRNLPEVSILPATVTPVVLAPQNQANTSKKKEKQAQKQQQKQEKPAEKFVDTNSGKSKNSTISVTPINMNVYDFVVRDSATDKTKRGAKSDNGKNVKVANSKNDKVQNVVPAPVVVPPANNDTEVKLTKKERKKLRREMKKLEEAETKEPEVVVSPDNKPQIVTIKRVMESNNAEPTVTITLKGQTPAEDKVLFTLVNGQTKEPGSAKTEQQQIQATSGKKKKSKGNSGGNQNQNGNQSQQTGKVQATTKQQTLQKGNDSKVGKHQQQQQTNNEKSKGKKGSEEKKVLQESQLSNIEPKSTKSKKEKKNAESKQIVAPATTAKSKNLQSQQQQTQQSSGKKQNKANTTQQTPVTQKSQQNANAPSENSKKKSKAQRQQQNEQNAQANLPKSKKKPEVATNNKKQPVENESQKNRTKSNQTTIKQQRANDESTKDISERHNALLSSQLKDFGPTSKINIENLKLPPGITITKVDAPAKSLPIKSAPMPKPVTATKQTTIIAAPMSGVQSSYPGPQTAGNVIVVDTGKLKQDLLPKNNDKSKEPQKDSQAGSTAVSGKKKKKKKGKNSAVVGTGVSVGNGSSRGGNDSGKENGDESAKIVHNPGSNMITIRNPAFGPAPKIDTTPQAAIIKVSENGMVTIRSPALQQAINAGLTPPSQPDFVVKGDPSLSNNNSSITNNRSTLTPTNSTNHKNANGIVSPSLAEFRSRLTADCTSLPGLANIHISKVTNGQPIPERGINLRGTSVTLTKVRSPDVPISTSLVSTKTNNTANIEEVQQAKTAVREAINATINVPATSSKGKKKKKRGNGTKHSGDDWNLVESVFTPKDIDLEDGEMDDAERELEAFKRFCLQSVPPPRKEKVNLNIKDIVLKKKSSSSSSSSSSSGGAAAPVIAAN
ncbi:serine-rich adhesin for platelets [Venturia canescens]|uniref:serine-rich adhesin for platelets n=1 Tax=Venturia canescens TaxID=32260 RepID=UPI001C9C840F|nr:serine-rich adhesin for platelets [Venturia canescens]XP_043269999.1 serine-rich adhesin for platelets [Venturia canescens]